MENHNCIKETEIALIKEHVKSVECKVNSFDEKLDRILDVLKGNGKRGLVTEVELLRASLTRLWWFVSVVCCTVVGLILKKYLG